MTQDRLQNQADTNRQAGYVAQAGPSECQQRIEFTLLTVTKFKRLQRVERIVTHEIKRNDEGRVVTE
jgi:hypothetical protein